MTETETAFVDLSESSDSDSPEEKGDRLSFSSKHPPLAAEETTS